MTNTDFLKAGILGIFLGLFLGGLAGCGIDPISSVGSPANSSFPLNNDPQNSTPTPSQIPGRPPDSSH